MGKLPASAADVTVLAELPAGAMKADEAADLALGMRCAPIPSTATRPSARRARKSRRDASSPSAVADAAKTRKAWAAREAIAEGVVMARDLVNEPANVLYPEEFARRASALKKARRRCRSSRRQGAEKLGMNALLGVGQGSARESRVVVMRWNGGKDGAQPLAFIGKGVCFDTGGISIKPAAGMEDMKGDMAGAACVVGLMHALAARKAKVNAVGVIGLVENMPDGNAQRPGDIVTSMSGQTIEIINTDAEGRLVLADVLWYVGTALQAEIHGRSCDADRRDHRLARSRICRSVLQRRQACRAAGQSRARTPASKSGACRSGRNTTSRSIPNSPT